MIDNVAGEERKRGYRYPRSHPFQDSELDRLAFSGRDTESEDLLRRVLSNNLLVFYGRSGLGKTSLLQAGIFPELRKKNFLPLLVRVNQLDQSPIERFKAAIEQDCIDQGVDYTPGPSTGLWEFFKTAIFWRNGELQIPVVILDQFEELFTLHRPHSRQAFIVELGELLATRLPASVRARRESGESLPYTDKPPLIKVIVSLRESYLGQLEAMTTDLPQVLSNRYRLSALDRESAARAIVEPARLPQEHGYLTPPFEYSESALHEIIGFLAGDGDIVEPFALQLVCSHIERRIVAGRVAAQSVVTIEPADFGAQKGLDRILSDFYTDVMNSLPDRRERKHAKRLCAEGLLSPGGRRLSLEQMQLQRQFNVDQKTLDRLVDERVLRKEPRLNSNYYELSHDRLTAPVLKTRRWRMPRFLRRILIAGAAALVVMLVSLILVSREQQRTAEARDSAQSLMDSIVFEMRDELNRIDRPDLLEPIINKIIEYFEKRDPDELSPIERNTFAASLALLAAIRQQGAMTDEAFTLHGRSIEKFRWLFDEYPDDAVYQRNLAVSLGAVADLSLTRGDIDGARQMALEQLELINKLEDRSDELVHRRDVAYSANLLGRIEFARGALDTARSYHEQETQILAELSEEYADDAGIAGQLVWAHINLADVDKEDGDLIAATKGYAAARDLSQRHADESPDDSNMQLSLGAAEQRLGDVYVARMQAEQAEQSYSRVITIFEGLRDNNPNSVFWYRNIAVGRERLGRLYATGVAESMSLMSQLAAATGAEGVSGTTQFELTADAAVWAQLERSFENYDTASRIVGVLVDADASVLEWHQDLAALNVGMARLTLTAGNVEAARQYVDAARVIVNELIAEEHEDVFTNINILETWLASGRLNLLSGDPIAARQEFEDALARAERLIEATTERNTWLEYVAESYDGIGDSAYYQNDFEKAAESYSKALAIRDSLAIKVPDNVMWRLHQAVSAYKLALLEAHVGGESSTRARNQALVLFNRLDSDGHLPAPVRLTLEQIESYRP